VKSDTREKRSYTEAIATIYRTTRSGAECAVRRCGVLVRGAGAGV
jgi:hypothetical protein